MRGRAGRTRGKQRECAQAGHPSTFTIITMKSLHRVCLFAFLASYVPVSAAGPATVPAQGNKAEDADSKQLQGNWKVVSMNYNGQDKTADLKDRPISWRIEGRKLFVSVGDRRIDSDFALDASKTPKRITVTGMQGNEKVTNISIYELHGSTLRMAFFMDKTRIQKDMPKSFEPGEAIGVTTLERGK